ncbi:MAG TPA: DUF3500 domain-containing protein [Steroidobacteraceae bacterium]|nr:DUF3500 domain-containing protein [Steroidobacteraceae bacterium]
MRGLRTWAMVLAAAAGGGLALLVTPHADAAKATAREGDADRAARAFLAALTPELRKTASFPADSPERLNWNYVPMDRAGVSMLQLDDRQSEALGPLLASALSPGGLLTARDVMKHENILRRVETEAGVANASRRDPGRYYTAVFGTPGAAAPWAWRFEGHHLSLNVTQIPGQPAVVTPMFVGANPAIVKNGPNVGYRMLAAEEDLGRELVKMLSAEQRKAATIQDEAFGEIVTRNDPKVAALETQGLAAADMSADQQAQLRRLLGLYIGRMNDASAKEQWARIERAGFGKLHFGWAGGVESGDKHYYRIHGPTVLVEYDDTQNNANHIHTVYRDLERDFGGDTLRAHYRLDRHDRMAALGAAR